MKPSETLLSPTELSVKGGNPLSQRLELLRWFWKTSNLFWLVSSGVVFTLWKILYALAISLKKDHEQQLEYNSRMCAKKVNPFPKTMPTGPPVEKSRPPVLCWRCKGNHIPGSCPHYSSPNTPRQQTPKSSSHGQETKGLSGNSFMSLVKSRKPVKQPPQQNPQKILSESTSEISVTPPGSSSSPLQLIVPITIGTWHWKAIVDTGASYTLIHEYLWKVLKGTKEVLQPWTEGPLYLANGEATTPIGWENLTMALHGHVSTLPVAVWGPKALAYSVVLGLNFISSVGMIINRGVTILQFLASITFSILRSRFDSQFLHLFFLKHRLLCHF